MADLAEVPIISKAAISGYYALVEHPSVDTSDTITLSEFASITTAKAVRLDTGAEITVTVATNVVTITQAALTDVPIILLAWGKRA